jgi:hypothetical protein
MATQASDGRTVVVVDGDWLFHATRKIGVTLNVERFAEFLRSKFGSDALLLFLRVSTPRTIVHAGTGHSTSGYFSVSASGSRPLL